MTLYAYNSILAKIPRDLIARGGEGIVAGGLAGLRRCSLAGFGRHHPAKDVSHRRLKMVDLTHGKRRWHVDGYPLPAHVDAGKAMGALAGGSRAPVDTAVPVGGGITCCTADEVSSKCATAQKARAALRHSGRMSTATSSAAVARSTALAGTFAGSAAQRPFRLLQVDDCRINRLLVTAMLTRWGIVPTIACNGSQAVMIAERHSFDIVIMDILMTVMDGVVATAKMR